MLELFLNETSAKRKKWSRDFWKEVILLRLTSHPVTSSFIFLKGESQKRPQAPKLSKSH